MSATLAMEEIYAISARQNRSFGRLYEEHTTRSYADGREHRTTPAEPPFSQSDAKPSNYTITA